MTFYLTTAIKYVTLS